MPLLVTLRPVARRPWPFGLRMARPPITAELIADAAIRLDIEPSDGVYLARVDGRWRGCAQGILIARAYRWPRLARLRMDHSSPRYRDLIARLYGCSPEFAFGLEYGWAGQ